MAILVTQTTKIKIPEVIENFRYSLVCEDYEECALIKKEFYERYNTLTDIVKKNVKGFIRSYLNENKLDPIKDMNNLFEEVFDQK